MARIGNLPPAHPSPPEVKFYGGLVLLGPPGAGKGTQAETLAQTLQAKHISTGDILREEISQETEIGQYAARFVRGGELVPDAVMLTLVEKGLQDAQGRFLLDGFPRTINQAQGLEALLSKKGVPLVAAVFLEVPDEEIIQRLSSRRVCPQCSALYNLIHDPPHRDELCDTCGTKLLMRPDDYPETIRRRLEVYHTATAPLIHYYQEKGLLVRVAGIGSPQKVHREIRRALSL